MAIADTDKVDFLWKRDIFGVSKTATTAAKSGSNETIPSAAPVYASNIWVNTDLTSIPATPPGATSTNVGVLTGSARIHCTTDPTAAVNETWLATTTQGDVTTREGDWIAPTFGSGYAVQVYIGDPNVGPAARIFPDTTNEEWVFDYSAGVLYFVNNVPANKTASIGSGTVSVSGNGIYIQGYRYIGTKGLTGGGGGTTSGTIDGGTF